MGLQHYSADEMAADFGRLESHGHVIQTQINQFNTLLDEAKSIAAAAAQTWTGSAHEAYAVQQKKWDAASADLNSCLMSINRALGETREEMAATDMKNAGMFH